MKRYTVTYRSRYYHFDISKRKISAPSKKWIRDNWHEIMLTDEYTIVKIEEEIIRIVIQYYVDCPDFHEPDLDYWR